MPTTKWGSKKVTSRRRLFKSDTVTLSIRWCRSDYLIFQQAFRGINKILVEKLDIFIIMYLDYILIYTKDPSQGHVKAVW